MVRKYYLGPSDGHGHYLYPGGEPYGSELGWAKGLITPATDSQWPRDTQAYQVGINYLKYAAYWRNPSASFQLKDFPFTVAGYHKLLPLAGIYDGTDPDLSAFRKAGGKLIIWQGWADQEVSPFGTVDYYKAVVKHAGGFTASQDFTRLYMIPGQYHCTTGGSPRMNPQTAISVLLRALMRWTEQGTGPGDDVVPPAATHRHPEGHYRTPAQPAQLAASRNAWPQHPLPLDRPIPPRPGTMVQHQGHGPDLHPQAPARKLLDRHIGLESDHEIVVAAFQGRDGWAGTWRFLAEPGKEFCDDVRGP